MMFPTHLRIAIASLRATKVRTALTTLGVMIGVASICLVLALGEGAKQAVGAQIKQRGQDVITLRPGKLDRGPNGNIINYNLMAALGATTLTERDYNTVTNTEGVEEAAPSMLINGSVRSGENVAKNASIVATTPSFDEVQQLDIRNGQFLDNSLDRQTAVLGVDLSIELYGTEDSIGRQVSLRNQTFTVIGVLKRVDQPTSLGSYDYNRTAFVSLEAGKAFNQGIAQIQQINVRTSSVGVADQTADRLHDAILKNHNGEEDFAVIRADEAIQITDGVFQILIGVTSAIASISLIVGGVGIMNIMLVSVTERTREIGIRKAIGATNGNILSQFLIESVIISLVGGTIGLIIAYILAYLISTFLTFQPALTIEIVAIAFVVSLVIGVLFGLFPALRAARKDPISALRQMQ
jgi:putative ABC transport system permease protein